MSGLYYYLYLVSLGKMKAPEGMEEQWTDSFPLHMRVLGLVKWILVVLFQVSILLDFLVFQGVCVFCFCTIFTLFQTNIQLLEEH